MSVLLILACAIIIYAYLPEMVDFFIRSQEVIEIVAKD